MEKGSIQCVIKGGSCSQLFNNLVILIVIMHQNRFCPSIRNFVSLSLIPSTFADIYTARKLICRLLIISNQKFNFKCGGVIGYCFYFRFAETYLIVSIISAQREDTTRCVFNSSFLTLRYKYFLLFLILGYCCINNH